MALVVVDSGVLIGFLDATDALHEASRKALVERERDDLRIPASVYAEILVAPFRAGARAVRIVDDFLADWAIRVEPVTAPVARRAARLRARRRGLRLPDALVIALADELDADALLTGDAAWRRVTRRAVVVRL